MNYFNHFDFEELNIDKFFNLKKILYQVLNYEFQTWSTTITLQQSLMISPNYCSRLAVLYVKGLNDLWSSPLVQTSVYFLMFNICKLYVNNKVHPHGFKSWALPSVIVQPKIIVVKSSVLRYSLWTPAPNLRHAVIWHNVRWPQHCNLYLDPRYLIHWSSILIP